MWLVLALAAAFLTSFLPIINKRLLTEANVSVVAWAVNAFSLPILAVASVLLLPVPAVDSLFWLGIVGSGVLNLLATLLSTRALKLGDASLVTPFLTFNPAFTLVVAAFTLDESPSVLGAGGVLLIVAGGYLFNIEKALISPLAPLKALITNWPVFLSILASFVWGLTPIAEKVAIQHSEPQNPSLVAFGSTAVMSLLLLPLMLSQADRPLAQIIAGRRGFLLAALIAGVAPIFGFTAIKLGLVGYVSAIFKLSTVGTVVWAAIFLRESGVKERLAGSAVMVSGALLLSL